MTRAEKYAVKKTRIEEFIAKHESLTKVGYYYHNNKAPSKMFDTLEEAQAYKKEIEKLNTQETIAKYKLTLSENIDFPLNIIQVLGLDLTSCVNEIEDRLSWLLKNTCFTDREEFIFYKRFKEYLTLDDVGKLMGITRERVRQIEAKMLRKMKRFARYLELGEYADKVKLVKKEYEEYVEKMKPLWTYETALAYIKEYENSHEEIKVLPKTNIELEDLDLSVRSWNCLRRCGVRKVEELLQICEEDLMRIRNMGKKSLKEIKDKLAKIGLELPEESICKVYNRGYGYKSFEFVGEDE